ncbi:MAG: hypothetical protein EWM50_05515 [Gottschalkiaceae bacterium]|nr:MAG: hypothetical protein EWM50_05515 [Gottschalkiaceae bacterium]
MAKYLFKKIDEVREDVIGLEVIDVEEKGQIMYLKDKKGRIYAIDFTGKDGAVVTAYSTDKEKLEELQMMFDALLVKLDIDEEELYKYMEY